MGDRASYAIREHDAIELFYAQFGAGAFLADIFWGPDTCEAMIVEQAPADDWLDDVFGEAAIAMCKDTRAVAFYDARYSTDTQQLAARLMSVLWPGWKVTAVRYVSAVAATLGIDLRDRERPLTSFVSDVGDLAGVCGRSLARGGLIEVVRGGQRDQRMVARDLHGQLWHGPRLLDAVPFMTPIADVRAGLASRFDDRGEPMPLLDRGAGIATIDVDRRTVDVTYRPAGTAAHAYAFTGAAAERWPGWTVRRHIGTAAEHFARSGVAMPPDLELAAPVRPLVEQLRDLAYGLFASEARKEAASEWLEHVLGWGGNLAEHPLPADERLQRFREAVATLELDDIARRDALVRATRASHDVSDGSAAGALELGPWGDPWSLATRRAGDATWALARCATEAPALLRWDDPGRPPRVVCRLGNEPRDSYPSQLEVAPSGRACAAVVASNELREVYWSDLASATATRIAASSPRANVAFRTRFVWSPAGDQVAFEVVDDRALGGVGETVVVVHGRDGYAGEQPGVAIARWSEDGLLVQRANATAASYAAEVTPFRSTASPELVRERMLGDVAEAATLARRARGLGSDPARAAELASAALELDPLSDDAFHAACDALEALGDVARLSELAERQVAVLPDDGARWRAFARSGDLHAAARAVALAPFDADGHLVHAIALVRAGRLDDAVAACARVIECDRRRRGDVAFAPGLAPLHGHPGWRVFDYARLVEEARYREAIALAPELAEAYTHLLELDLDADERLDITDRWRTGCPDSRDAWLAHAEAALAVNALDDARRSIDEVLARWPQHPMGHFLRARLAIDEDGDAAALEHLSRGAIAACEAGNDARREFYTAVAMDDALAALRLQIDDGT